MKKFLYVAASLLMATSLIACGGKDEGRKDDGKASESKVDVIMITDVGTIDDKSFNQGTRGDAKAYGEEAGKRVEHIKSTEKSDNVYKETIDQVVNRYKVKVVVTPGYLFEPSIYEKQDTYPDARFILTDGYSNDGAQESTKFKTVKNTVGIKHSEDKASYTAGYAIVKESKTELGFMGGIAIPAVVNLGYGFVQGTQDATKEMNAKIEMKYRYTGIFNPSAETQPEVASWYKNGTQVIFSCGGGVGNSVVAAAEANKGLVIGVSIDQSNESSTAITSAYKWLVVSVTKEPKATDDGAFSGGENIVLGAGDDSVGLPMKTNKFEKLIQKEYDTLYTKIKEGKITIKINEDLKDPTQIRAPKIRLDYIERRNHTQDKVVYNRKQLS